MENLKNVGHDILRGTAGEAAAGTATGIKILTHFSHPVLGATGAAGVLALLSQWDHNHERDQLRAEYENEIAAQLKKSPRRVTVNDLEQAAKQNPTLNEALRRSRTRRNLSIAITTVGTFLSFALATAVAAPLLATPLAAMAVSGLVSFTSFMAIEKVMDKVGSRILHLNEPSLKEAEHNPRIQGQLSLPNQVRLIERMQGRRETVSQEQVLTAFLAANPELGRDIASRYGAPFSALPDSARAAAALEMGPALNLARLTSDINTRQMRAQELAFIVQGQNSGVPRLENPHVTSLERANAELKERVGKLEERLGHIGGSVQQGAQAAMQKMGFAKSNVSGASLDTSSPLPAAQQPSQPPSDKWQREVTARRQQQAAASPQMAAG